MKKKVKTPSADAILKHVCGYPKFPIKLKSGWNCSNCLLPIAEFEYE